MNACKWFKFKKILTSQVNELKIFLRVVESFDIHTEELHEYDASMVLFYKVQEQIQFKLLVLVIINVK